MGMNSQSRVPPLAERGTWGVSDQRTEDSKTTGTTVPHHREKEKERHIETGTTNSIDRPAMIVAAAVRIEAEAAAREGIDRRTMEDLPVER